MKNIELKFNRYFSRWDIRIPKSDLINRQRGKILKNGWFIQYLFDSNKHGEFLDFYAIHRMTSDRHIRFYLDGKVENLPTMLQFRICSDDPEEDKKLQAEYFSNNREVRTILLEKGFKLTNK